MTGIEVTGSVQDFSAAIVQTAKEVARIGLKTGSMRQEISQEGGRGSNGSCCSDRIAINLDSDAALKQVNRENQKPFRGFALQ